MMQRFFAFILLFCFLPLLLVLYLITKCTSKGPFLFKQKRAGKNNQPFWMYKIRTMVHNAETAKKNYLHLNEADGPVFKIRNDPRYTQFGKYLSHMGIDELPQLINVLKGEMSFVGPRPLPLNEAKKISSQYQKRASILPGITSSWVINGAHMLSFEEWMNADMKDIDNKNWLYDSSIFLKTLQLVVTCILKVRKHDR